MVRHGRRIPVGSDAHHTPTAKRAARRWIDAGARRLHLVDLNGAFAGKPVNEPAIKSLLAEVGNDIPVQLGGGIRDLDTIERYLDDGISYIIIGTAAVKSPGFLRDACSAIGGHIIVGIQSAAGALMRPLHITYASASCARTHTSGSEGQPSHRRTTTIQCNTAN